MPEPGPRAPAPSLTDARLGQAPWCGPGFLLLGSGVVTPELKGDGGLDRVPGGRTCVHVGVSEL